MSTAEATATTESTTITAAPALNPIEVARATEVAIQDGQEAARRVTVQETLVKLLQGPIAADRSKALLAMRLRRSRIVESDYKTKTAHNKALKEASTLETPLGGLSYKSPGSAKASIDDAAEHLTWALENDAESVEEYQEIDAERIHEALALLLEHKPELVLTRKRVTDEATTAHLAAAVRSDDGTVKLPVSKEPVLSTVEFIKYSTPTAENTAWSASKSKSAGEDVVDSWLEGNRESIITAIAGVLTAPAGAEVNA
ncbi:hypothetical protein [Pseudoclavibacter sp. VKM Ac-2867]|uniref:hypothetical protein n=1 Tax=Pseudoclavibacter sp. VKM Ac-2867 TaxID=2783829 RepID=UPI00188BCA9C|nr:hypothetical protein [Pseudoclavibacter sp. VKM Ac-2867]MBF4459374.1 hypothetical protein [Pseudoclavibacter sp. VKM Ac-2867]